MWDLMKNSGTFTRKLIKDGAYYKDFRKSIAEQGFKLESNSGNWDFDKVIKNIDDFLLGLGTKMTYKQYVESAFQHKKEPLNQYEYYTAAYLMLDMIGYKSDKLPKSTDNMQNIQIDGEHSFYGAHCDYFVAIDKKLRIKSKVLYYEYNIITKVIEPSELIPELKKVIDPIEKKTNFLEETFAFCQKENLVESFFCEDDNIETFVYRLPIYYFNFFNFVILHKYPAQEVFIFTFKRVFKNFSRFIYYTEAERVIDAVTNFFGYDDKEELKKKKQELVYENQATVFDWAFEGGLIRLENDEENRRPILIYAISTKKSET